MKTHGLWLLIAALVVAMVLPVSASAGWRVRERRRAERNDSQATAQNAPPTNVRFRAYWKGRTDYLSPREWDNWAYNAPLRARNYYRRNGLPAPANSRAPIASTSQSKTTPPRNFVEQSNPKMEQLPALHEPTLAAGAAGRVEPASATEPLPAFDAQAPVEASGIPTAGSQWPQVRREENQEWRDQRIRELEARIQALEAAQADKSAQSMPLPGPAE